MTRCGLSARSSLAGMMNATEFTNLTSPNRARDPIKKSNWLSLSFISWTNETRLRLVVPRWSWKNIVQYILAIGSEPRHDNNNKTLERLWILVITIYISNENKIKHLVIENITETFNDNVCIAYFKNWYFNVHFSNKLKKKHSNKK